MTVRILRGDCLDVLRTLPADSVHCCVTDPPYELGFMGRRWDQTGVAFRPETWRAVYDVLKPGAHLVAFGGTRTFHRMACAIEDAGFEIRDTLCWLYGSGFPKSLDVSKAIDKARDDRPDILRVTRFLADAADRCGLSRADVDAHMGTSDMGGWWLSRLKHRCACPQWDQWLQLKAFIGFGDEMDAEVWRLNGRKGQPGEAWHERDVIAAGKPKGKSNGIYGDFTEDDYNYTAPATDLARQWAGWGTALKPAYEPIILARRPLQGTVAANVLAHGTGAININGCRVSSVAHRAGDNSAGNGHSHANARRTNTQSTGHQETSDVRHALHACLLSSALERAREDRQSLNSIDGCLTCPHCGDAPPRLGGVDGQGLLQRPNDVDIARGFSRCPRREHILAGLSMPSGSDTAPHVEQQGRYPANLLHDGSDEVEAAFAAFGERPTGDVQSYKRANRDGYSGGMPEYWNGEHRGDTGSASRFFYEARLDVRCGLCNSLCVPDSDTVAGCKDASNAGLTSSARPSAADGSARRNVPEHSRREVADNERQATLLVDNAARSFTQCHQPKPSTARQNAEAWPLEKIVQNVRSAATLCASCATAIAQSLARARSSRDSRSLPLVGFINASHEKILNRCLALYVEGRESTDIILTIPSLSTLFGSVFHAIAESTRQASAASSVNTESVPTRFHYSSKADAADRADSRHPTIKPVALLRWLVRLVTPPGGTVLDPFAGSGTTGEAAMLEGFDAVLIERDEQHADDIAHRIKRWSGADLPLLRMATA